MVALGSVSVDVDGVLGLVEHGATGVSMFGWLGGWFEVCAHVDLAHDRHGGASGLMADGVVEAGENDAAAACVIE